MLPRALIGLFLASLYWVGAAEERLRLPAQLNGQSARIFLDTGAAEFYLFRPAAERFGFELPDGSSEPWQLYWAGEKCTVTLAGIKARVRPVIMEPPPFVSVQETDGFVGWKLFRDKVIQFDAANGAVSALDSTPEIAKHWTRLKVRKKPPSSWRKWGILALETPKPAAEIIIIDTGQSLGVGLPKAKWATWKSSHPNQPITLAAAAMPSVGIFAREQSWAKELQLGPLQITDTLVGEADPWSHSMVGEKHGATLGLAALARLDMIVDGKRGIAYIRPKQNRAAPPNHNRLGAVFLPSADGKDLVAVVHARTPASEAGIRDGDILIGVNGTDLTDWKEKLPTLLGGRVGRFWEEPAGTRLRLRLKRGDQNFAIDLVLRDLL